MLTEQLVLTKEILNKISDCLHKYIDSSNARCALLLSNSGQLLFQTGFVSNFDTLSISALIAGVFNSTQALANLVGEEAFSLFIQEGSKLKIHYSILMGKYIFATVFDDAALLGVIQMSVKETSEELQKILSSLEKKPEGLEVFKPTEKTMSKLFGR